jgi:hypothetical protein
LPCLSKNIIIGNEAIISDAHNAKGRQDTNVFPRFSTSNKSVILKSNDSNVFGKFEDLDQRTNNKIEYANNKYLEFKQKMKYVYINHKYLVS